MRKPISLLLSVGLIAHAHAASTSNLTSTAKLSATCILSATNVNFGVIDPTSGHTATGELSVLCSSNAAYTVALNFPYNGQGNTGGIYFSGIMRPSKPDNSDFMNYNIFYPNDDNSVWGSGATAGNSVTGGMAVKVLNATGTGSNQTYPVKVLESTETSDYKVNVMITPDTYSDVVTVVVSY